MLKGADGLMTYIIICNVVCLFCEQLPTEKHLSECSMSV